MNNVVLKQVKLISNRKHNAGEKQNVQWCQEEPLHQRAHQVPFDSEAITLHLYVNEAAVPLLIAAPTNCFFPIKILLSDLSLQTKIDAFWF